VGEDRFAQRAVLRHSAAGAGRFDRADAVGPGEKRSVTTLQHQNPARRKQHVAKLDLHSHESAPEASKPLLAAAEGAFGFIPNISAVLAESPETLKAYMTLSRIFDETSFTAEERQVVILSINEYNECHYCVAAHSAIAEMHGVPDHVIEALRGRSEIDDPRLNALRTFTHKVLEQRGWVAENDLQTFLDAGFGRRQMLEVIFAVAMKTISNYANHIADTPLDEAFAPYAWSADAGAETA
jgi:uncharacterized peroxidase-related enzyme